MSVGFNTTMQNLMQMAMQQKFTRDTIANQLASWIINAQYGSKLEKERLATQGAESRKTYGTQLAADLAANRFSPSGARSYEAVKNLLASMGVDPEALRKTEEILSRQAIDVAPTFANIGPMAAGGDISKIGEIGGLKGDVRDLVSLINNTLGSWSGTRQRALGEKQRQTQERVAAADLAGKQITNQPKIIEAVERSQGIVDRLINEVQKSGNVGLTEVALTNLFDELNIEMGAGDKSWIEDVPAGFFYAFRQMLVTPYQKALYQQPLTEDDWRLLSATENLYHIGKDWYSRYTKRTDEEAPGEGELYRKYLRSPEGAQYAHQMALEILSEMFNTVQ